MSLAHELGERIAAIRYEDLPPEAIYWSKVALLDTVGVALAGAIEPPSQILAEVIGCDAADGASLVWGSRRRAGCLDAALINATAAHALDFDNTSNTMAGHMSATMLPALIAAGEAFGASGRDVLLAHTVGFETGARFGHGLNFYHHEKGWHPTSTLGVFAVTAACSRLLGLTAEQTATALGLATSLAAGTKANFGTMTKPLHAGQCARSGLLAALLVRKGFTANPGAFEHKQGFFKVFNGEGNYDAARILEGWGKPFDVVAPGACYKQYPSCAGTHAPIDVALKLAREHGTLDPQDIVRIETWTSKHRLPHTDRPDPRTGLEAKFSVQYCVVRALIDGKVVFGQFEGDAPRDAIVRALLPRVHSTTYDEARFARDNPNGAEIRVTLADGRVLIGRADRALGRTTGNPIPLEQLQAKFADCAARVLEREPVRNATRMIDAFESVALVREFTVLLEPVREPAREPALSAA